MMKRIITLTLALLLLLTALAEDVGYGYILCECRRKKCLCFLQEGDTGTAVGGVTEFLKARQYLPEEHARMIFDREVTNAVKAFQKDCGIDATGKLDDLTLTWLIWGNEDVWYNEYAEYASMTAWVSTSGGTKYHSDPYCSAMTAPRKMSVLNAEALGMDPCKRCYSY